jgi:hypothetical protein
MAYRTLHYFFASMRAAETVPRPPDESWGDLINRTSRPGVVCVIDAETYDYFLEVLPPKYLGHGFAFAEGAEPLRLFWHTKPDSYFCRQLTWEETTDFCRLAGIALPR